MDGAAEREAGQCSNPVRSAPGRVLPMKLLFVAGDVNRIGGIEKYNRDFVSALAKTGAMVILVERRKGGFTAKLSFLVRFVWQFLRKRPDVVFCGHLNFSPACLIIKALFGTPYTLALYGIEAIEIRGFLKRRAVRGAERIITISDYAQSLILKQFPDVKKRIFMLPSAVDGSVLFRIKEKNAALIEKHGLAGRPVILSLARLSTSEHKGQDRVLKALPYVLEKVPDAVYLIVGSGNDERVDAILKAHPELGKSVVLAGPVSDGERADYYNLGDVYALPSKFEGFGIVFIESLACGVPVVASDAYGCREGLLDGELGLLVPPDDPRAIADAIVAILARKAPPVLFNREYLRSRTLDVYGIDAWNERVAKLVELVSLARRSKKLAIFMSHPIQYQASLLKKLARHPDFETHVYFFWDFGVRETYEADFKRAIKWDIPVLEGYQYSFLRNYSLRPSSNFWGAINFGVIPAIVRRRYDAILVFGWGIFSNWLAIVSALVSGTRVILHGESPLNQEAGKKGWKRAVRNRVLRRLFRHVSAFLYIGKENREFYEHFGVPPEKLHFAPYAVDNERYFREAESLMADKNLLKKNLGIDEGGAVILFVGKLSEKKRPLDLLKAYEILLKSWEGDTKPALVFVGDGLLRNELERRVAERGLTKVYFAGFKNQLELSSYYAIADVFVLPSGAGETWGLVVNEAMCFGLPVIVSDMVGCRADLVSQGENGLVFPLGDSGMLAKHLSEMLRNEGARKMAGKRSREIIERYSQERDVEGIRAALYSCH